MSSAPWGVRTCWGWVWRPGRGWVSICGGPGGPGGRGWGGTGRGRRSWCCAGLAPVAPDKAQLETCLEEAYGVARHEYRVPPPCTIDQGGKQAQTQHCPGEKGKPLHI